MLHEYMLEFLFLKLAVQLNQWTSLFCRYFVDRSIEPHDITYDLQPIVSVLGHQQLPIELNNIRYNRLLFIVG